MTPLKRLFEKNGYTGFEKRQDISILLKKKAEKLVSLKIFTGELRSRKSEIRSSKSEG